MSLGLGGLRSPFTDYRLVGVDQNDNSRRDPLGWIAVRSDDLGFDGVGLRRTSDARLVLGISDRKDGHDPAGSPS